jgi:hypothetical protein
MAPRRNRARRRGRLARPTAMLDYEFCYRWEVAEGQAQQVWEPTFSALAIDSSRPLRVRHVTLDLATSSGSCVSVEMSLFGPPSTTETNSIVIRSRAKTVGVTPQRLSLKLPPQIDFYTPAGNNPLFRLYAGQAIKGSGVSGQYATVAISGTVVVEFERRSTLTTVAKA